MRSCNEYKLQSGNIADGRTPGAIVGAIRPRSGRKR